MQVEHQRQAAVHGRVGNVHPDGIGLSLEGDVECRGADGEDSRAGAPVADTAARVLGRLSGRRGQDAEGDGRDSSDR